MPELPEVEIVCRVIGEAVAGARVDSVRAGGLNTLKSFDPPLETLSRTTLEGLRRRGKHILIDFDNSTTLLLHLMSAGRLGLFEDAASPKDRSVRLVINLADGRQLRLREFGTRQSSWAKLLRSPDVGTDEALAGLGPEAWPDPPDFKGLLNQPRPLSSLLRDQRAIAGIGRSWVDEILHAAGLSPFKRGDDLSVEEAERLRSAAIEKLGGAIRHYEQMVGIPIPDKLPMPLKVHRHTGRPCPRCGAELKAVFYEDREMTYCPACQTSGKLLKDRRLSRLLK